MVIVMSGVSAEEVLASGGLACPCGERLSPWGYARSRRVRGVERVVRPRRGRRRTCGATQVLLPPSLLVRRADGVSVIGAGLERAAHGAGFRSIAAESGVPESTVRRWLRRARVNAAGFAMLATRWARRLDPSAVLAWAPGLVPVAVVVEAAGALAAAAVRRAGTVVAAGPWALASTLTNGALLGPRLTGV